MIPLQTELRPKRLPWMNWLLIMANLAVFFYQIRLGWQLNAFIEEFSLIPARLLRGGSYTTLVTFAFLHGGWLHLLGNLLTLWVFGENVEDKLGHFRYLGFYLLAGAISGVGQVIAHPTSTVPCVGASGAIAGVLGAALVLFPRAWVKTLIPFVVIFRVVRVPAFFFLVVWFVGQVLLNQAMQNGQETSIAVMAHIVGFVFGVIAAVFVK